MSHEAEKECHRAEVMLDTTVDFSQKQDENTLTLAEAQRKLARLYDYLPEINDLVNKKLFFCTFSRFLPLTTVSVFHLDSTFLYITL